MAAPSLKLAHIHLKVRDLERAVAFYTVLLGFKVSERVGKSYAFLSMSDAHHDVALQQVGAGAPAPPSHGVGLYHAAFEVPDRESLVRLYDKLREAGVSVVPSDHLVSWAIYFNDPDGNGLEVFWDTRDQPTGRSSWNGENRPLRL